MRPVLLLLLTALVWSPVSFARSRAIGPRPLLWHAPACTEIRGLAWIRFIDANGELRQSVDPELFWRVPAVTTEDLAVGPRPNELWATTSDGAILQSLNGGCSWSVRATAPEVLGGVFEPRIIARHPGRVYVYTTPMVSLFGPTDFVGGDKAMLVRLTDDTIETFPLPEHVLELGVDPVDPGRLRAIGLTGAIHDSADGGASWQRKGLGGFGSLTTARIDPANLDRIAVAPRAGGVRITGNGGLTVAQPPSILATSLVSHIYFSPVDPTLLWADAYDPYARVSGLYRSIDGGASFTLQEADGSSTYLTGGIFAAHPRDRDTFALPANLGVRVVSPAGTRSWHYDMVKKVIWSPSGTLYYLVQVVESR